MKDQRVNLQNAPLPPGVTRRVEEFAVGGALLKGILYLPVEAQRPLPAVIVTGAWTTIKEQMPGTYALALASRGYAALAFDFRGWGESGGEPRYVEDPIVKTEDIHAAVAYLAGLDDINPARIAGLGVCASAGYMAAAVADNHRFNRLALVAPWLHDPAMVEPIYGGREAVDRLVASSETENAAATVLPAASAQDPTAVMFRIPYYTETDRGLIPEYDNKFSVLSWKAWLTYDAFSSADRLNKPMLMVGSPSMALPASAAAYAERTRAPQEKVWLGTDVTQFDFYDRTDVVKAAADAAAAFFNR